MPGTLVLFCSPAVIGGNPLAVLGNAYFSGVNVCGLQHEPGGEQRLAIRAAGVWTDSAGIDKGTERCGEVRVSFGELVQSHQPGTSLGQTNTKGGPASAAVAGNDR